MDPSLLTSAAFWDDAASPVAEIPVLSGHVLFETSGSTGVPKWVALSKQALLISAAAVNRYLEVTPESRWGLALPVNHVGGFGVAARAYQAGCGLGIFNRRWDPAAFLDWLEREEITHTSLVPAQVHDLVKADLTAPAAVVAIVAGGGHLDTATGQAARDLGWPVLASFGMTEAASQIATQGLADLGSLYQPAPLPLLPIWTARLTAENLLAISGPALFSGYLTGGKFTPRVSEWHITSDQVVIEKDRITPLRRTDHLVKVLGELVDPEAIERELIALSQGLLAAGNFAVIPIPDDRAGHALVLVLESAVGLPTIESTLGIYNAGAPGFLRVRPAAVIGEFPRSDLGKLQRGGLAALYSRQFASPDTPPS